MAQDSGISGLASLGRLTELRKRLVFTLLALVVFRLGSFVPVPGVDPEAMLRVMSQQQGTIVDMLNMFSGGALERFSLFALGVMPYISASIIIQLMATALPSMQAWRKEGESGRRKINQLTRYSAVVLAAVQAFAAANMLQAQSNDGIPVVFNPGMGFIFTAVVSLTAGTMFVMWLGEQITERGIGNGISLVIFAGIVAELPGAVVATLAKASEGDIDPLALIFVALIVVATTAAVVFIERGQRRITVNYARRAGGRNAYQNQSSHLPLKINMAGVIPAIFASSIIMFPATLLQMFSTGQEQNLVWLQKAAAVISPGQPLYMILYATLIVGFAFFYTALQFNSQETAENLKKSGALIPGIRPGKATGEYLDGVMTRLTLAGSLYLVAVCLLPEFLQRSYNLSFYFGGTSLLIVVVVVMDTMAQVQAHLLSHQYDSVLKKANFKGLSRSGVVR